MVMFSYKKKNEFMQKSTKISTETFAESVLYEKFQIIDKQLVTLLLTIIQSRLNYLGSQIQQPTSMQSQFLKH
jgi:hypothetical protein